MAKSLNSSSTIDQSSSPLGPSEKPSRLVKMNEARVLIGCSSPLCRWWTHRGCRPANHRVADTAERAATADTAASRSASVQGGSQRVQKAPGSLFSLGRGVVAIEERPLLRHDQLRRCLSVAELDRGHGHGDAGLVGVHLVRVDDPPLGNDVVELQLVRIDRPARRPAPIDLTASDPEVEVVAGSECIGGAGEPAGLEHGVRPGPEDLTDRYGVDPLDDERVMRHGGRGHRFSSVGAPSFRMSPSRSRRSSQPRRRSVIHCSAAVIAARSIRHVRVLPTFSVFTSPHDSRTCTCWSTAARDMARGAANSLTEAGPRVSRSTMVRLLWSASAWNVRSRSVIWSGIYLSIRPQTTILKWLLKFLRPDGGSGPHERNLGMTSVPISSMVCMTGS